MIAPITSTSPSPAVSWVLPSMSSIIDTPATDTPREKTPSDSSVKQPQPGERKDHASFASRNRQGIFALTTGVGVQVLGNFKSYALDRGRLGVAAAQEIRGGNAHWTPLLLGVGAGVGLAGHGLYDLNKVTKDGMANVFSADGALAVGEVGAGAGVLALGVHKGLPNGISLLADIFRGPTTSSVPVTGGKWGLWGKTFRASNIIGTSMGVLMAVAGGANLVDGYKNNGQNSPAGFVNTKSGRAGLIYTAMASSSFAYSGYAGVKGVKEGRKFIEAANGSEWLMKPRVRNAQYGIGLVLGGLWALNQFTDVLSGLNHLGGKDPS